MTIKSDVESANAAYAESFGDKADLALPPARGFLILTCMDARLDPAKYAGLAEGDAHVVRNAGGRATDDAIRSMVISHKLLGTREWFVIHHTDCGMLFFDDGLMGDLLAGSLETAELTPEGFRNRSEPGGSTEGRFVKWHTIADQEASVLEDVTRTMPSGIVHLMIDNFERLREARRSATRGEGCRRGPPGRHDGRGGTGRPRGRLHGVGGRDRGRRRGARPQSLRPARRAGGKGRHRARARTDRGG